MSINAIQLAEISKIISQPYLITDEDINVIGEKLGYEWNDVCDAVRDANFYAQDGSGYFIIRRSHKNYYTSVEMINKIISAIFESDKNINELYIVSS